MRRTIALGLGLTTASLAAQAQERSESIVSCQYGVSAPALIAVAQEGDRLHFRARAPVADHVTALRELLGQHLSPAGLVELVDQEADFELRFVQDVTLGATFARAASPQLPGAGEFLFNYDATYAEVPTTDIRISFLSAAGDALKKWRGSESVRLDRVRNEFWRVQRDLADNTNTVDELTIRLDLSDSVRATSKGSFQWRLSPYRCALAD